MRQDWREFSGFGELLCLVLAWTVGLGAIWIDQARGPHKPSGENVAVRGEHHSTTPYFD
jgi:hypothetical protein